MICPLRSGGARICGARSSTDGRNGARRRCPVGPLLVSRAYDSPSPFVRRACLDIGTALPSWQHSKKRLFLLRRFVGRMGSRRRFIDKICCMKAYLHRRTSVPCLGVSVCACSGEHVEMCTALFTLAVCAVVTGLRQFLPRVTIVRALSLLVVPGWPWGRAACLRLAYAGLSRRRHSRGTCLSTRRICRFTTLVSAMICHSASLFLCRVGRMCYREAAGDRRLPAPGPATLGGFTLHLCLGGVGQMCGARCSNVLRPAAVAVGPPFQSILSSSVRRG